MNTTQGAARRQVSDVVAERIERLIVDGVLKVGQPLPSERRLCEKLGITTTIEGVETQAQLDQLKQEHCAEGQGYVFGRPMPLAKVEDFILQWPARWNPDV